MLSPVKKGLPNILRRLSSRLPNVTSSSIKKKEPILFKASLVTRSLPTPSLEELPLLLKASLGSRSLPSATSKRLQSSRTQELEVLKTLIDSSC